MSSGGTDRYTAESSGDLPALVTAAVERARALGFELCVRPEIGRLLAVLAGGLPPGSLVGETGTGTGAGLAWMATAAHPGVRFISYRAGGGPCRCGAGALNGAPDESRVHWLDHPQLRATEIRVAPDLAVIVCRHLPPTH